MVIDLYTKKQFDRNHGITLSTALAEVYSYFGDTTFLALGMLSTEKFYVQFPSIYKKVYGTQPRKRRFLFNDECVAKEIK